jgi:hypothetical protein
MEKLALSMRSNSTKIPRQRLHAPPGPAYTYFGQLIFHDLTFDDTPLFKCPAPDPSDIRNHRTPFLDLDCLYGSGPDSEDAAIYEPDRLRLRIGEALTSNAQTFDLPLDSETSEPLIADSRNNENIIIRQIHTMFLKLHNKAVVELAGNVPENELFGRARQRVRWQYQWLIVNDYLKRVCCGAVYDETIISGKTRIEWENRFSIPVEFAHAVGRFGHSMVRPSYELNNTQIDVPLARIFADAHKSGPLDAQFAVDWHKFTRAAVSNAVDTTIAEGLYDLPSSRIQPFVARLSSGEPNAVPVRTLYRNVTMRLPTAQQVINTLDASAQLNELEPDPSYDPFTALRELGLTRRTPLWYYVLLEGEINEGGGNLGTIGSRIVTEVIHACLRHDPDSIFQQLRCDPAWRPPAWQTRGGEILIDDFYDLAVVVGLV